MSLNTSRRSNEEPTVIFRLNNGFLIKMSHSILRGYSIKFQSSDEPISMVMFDASSVKQVVDWMYTKNLIVTSDNYLHFYMIAQFIESPTLSNYLLEKVSADPEMAIRILNRLAKKYIKEYKPQKTFAPYLTLCQVSNEVLDFLVEVFSLVAPKLAIDQVKKLNIESIFALMVARLPVDKKASLVFLAVDWIALFKPSRNTVYAILQSLYITNCQKMFNLRDIRIHMILFLTKLYSTSSKFVIYQNGYSELIEPSNQEIQAQSLEFSTFNDPNNVELSQEMSSARIPVIYKPIKRDIQRRPVYWVYQPRGNVQVEPASQKGTPVNYQGKMYEYYESRVFVSTIITKTCFLSYGMDKMNLE